MKRPNHIIFLLSDQHNADCMAWRGDPWLRTPAFDRLAAEGAACTSTYCGSPLCVPSRSSLLATRLPQATGVFTNDQCLPSDRIIFVHELGNAGYRTVLCGRMHFKGPDQRHGFHERLVGDIGDTNWSGRKAGAGARAFGGYGAGHKVLAEAGPGRSRVMAYDEAVIDAACQRIADQPADEPLFLTVGTYGPHSPYVCDPERFAYYYEALPRLSPEALPEELHPAVRDAYERMGMVSPDAEAMHRARAAYYGLVETLDGHLARLRAAAQAAFGDEVLFVYSSDHGDMASSRGLFWKQNFYEGAVRVPLLVAGPGISAGHRLAEPTSLMDLGVSLLSAAGAEAMIETDGENLWPAL
jgi:choline-sulfatase